MARSMDAGRPRPCGSTGRAAVSYTASRLVRSERPHTAEARGFAANGVIDGFSGSEEVPGGGGLLAVPVLASGVDETLEAGMADYATLLRDQVRLTCRSVDRIFLQAYVPRLQSLGMVCQFLRWQRGFPIPSSAAFGKIGAAYSGEVHRFAKENGIPVRYFAKGEKKEEIARPFIEAAAAGGKGAVALIGIAQEKASAWRSWPAGGQRGTGHPHMEWGRQM